MSASLFPDPPDRDIYTVSRLNRAVRQLLERGLAVLWVEGELSNFSQPSSGHWYFTLKDRDAQLRCAMFRQKNSGLRFTPVAGSHVLARGRISLYEARGDYQLIVEHMEEAGLGALNREFERVKNKLATEGLFAAALKRGLPRFPRRIGVISSPSGAAIRDILNVLARRYPPAGILLYPTAVQGAAAVPELLAALALAAARRECDVLIVARGGGSIEDLWAFNDERVARAIRASPIPIVAGIGHEIDFTIADFVADARAPTPSGAAEVATPDRRACLEALDQVTERLKSGLRRELRTLAARLDAAAHRFKLVHPAARLAQQNQRLDELEQRLARIVGAGLGGRLTRISELWGRLVQQTPDRLAREYCLRHEALAGRLQHALRDCLARAEHRFTLAHRTLNTVSPLATLDRGFAIVTRAADGSLLTDSTNVGMGEEIDARLARGVLRARVVSRN